jgi:hypothetical protein
MPVTALLNENCEGAKALSNAMRTTLKNVAAENTPWEADLQDLIESEP